MYTRTLRAFFIGLMLIPTVSHADEFRVRGAGTASCGYFIQKPNDRVANLQWVLGFVTGTNAIRVAALGERASVDVLNATDIDAIELWLTNYCTQNPLKNISDAAMALVVEGLKQQR